jgi:hypothetical protein
MTGAELAALRDEHSSHDELLEYQHGPNGPGRPAWASEDDQRAGRPPIGRWIVIGYQQGSRCFADDHGETGVAWPCMVWRLLDEIERLKGIVG